MKIGHDYIGVGCGALIVNDKNETLLIKRSSKARNNAGYWSQPGGTVEFNEKVTDAIRREIKEELDIDFELTTFLGYVDHIMPQEGQHWVSMAYLAKIIGGEVRNMEPDKHEEVAWFPLDSLPGLLTDVTVLAVNQRNAALSPGVA